MLCVLCDRKKVVYHEHFKPCETVHAASYRRKVITLNHALVENRKKWARRQGKVILQHDNADAHSAWSV